MALTLIEAAKLATDPLARGVIQIFASSSPILEKMPFFTISGQAYRYVQEEALSGVAFRGVNQSYVESTGVLNPQIEALYVLGGISSVDRALTKTQGNIFDLRSVYDGMKAKAGALTFTEKFFSGDNASDPNEFDGLANRLTGTQVINQGSTSGGDALTLAKLDEMLDQVAGGADAIYCNRTIRRKISALVRAEGQATEVVSDAFGRQLTGYSGIPIYPIETGATGAEILGFKETGPGGGSAVCTSIYAVRYGALEYVSGIQSSPLEVIDLGLQRTVYETLIEWLCGMAVFHPRAAARLQGIKNV